jgi:nucleotide-binding universal stress UspA family protein
MTMRPVIIVGVDDSATSRRALAWALAEAARLGAVVEAVTTYDAAGGEAAREVACSRQQSVIDEVIGEVPADVVPRHVLPGKPVDVLTLRSRDAYLLVLGGHSTAGLRHSGASSTAEQVARLAECPVVIVPAPPVLASHVA